MQQQNQYLEKLNTILEKHSNVQNTFQNTRYQFNRRDRKTLIIDQVIGTDTTFSTTLVEPLIIDKLSDIYLEHFTTFDSRHNYENADGNDCSFVLGIDQFNITNSSNNESIMNKLLIPSEENDATGDRVRIHKGKKLNYT